jgi:hypothetical protein
VERIFFDGDRLRPPADHRPQRRTFGRRLCGLYRAGQRLEDQRQGITHDYERRKGVLAEGVLLPQDAPEWMRDRAALWNAGVE